jgi:hypothetical protein
VGAQPLWENEAQPKRQFFAAKPSRETAAMTANSPFAREEDALVFAVLDEAERELAWRLAESSEKERPLGKGQSDVLAGIAAKAMGSHAARGERSAEKEAQSALASACAARRADFLREALDENALAATMDLPFYPALVVSRQEEARAADIKIVLSEPSIGAMAVCAGIGFADGVKALAERGAHPDGLAHAMFSAPKNRAHERARGFQRSPLACALRADSPAAMWAALASGARWLGVDKSRVAEPLEGAWHVVAEALALGAFDCLASIEASPLAERLMGTPKALADAGVWGLWQLAARRTGSPDEQADTFAAERLTHEALDRLFWRAMEERAGDVRVLDGGLWLAEAWAENRAETARGDKSKEANRRIVVGWLREMARRGCDVGDSLCASRAQKETETKRNGRSFEFVYPDGALAKEAGDDIRAQLALLESWAMEGVMLRAQPKGGVATRAEKGTQSPSTAKARGGARL